MPGRSRGRNNGRGQDNNALVPTSSSPLDNEFFQFYSQLHQSSVLFSDRSFQQWLLFPTPASRHRHQGGTKKSSSSSDNKLQHPHRSFKTARRRLSSSSDKDRGGHPHHHPVAPILLPLSSMTVSSSSHASSSSSSGKDLERFFKKLGEKEKKSSTPNAKDPAASGGKKKSPIPPEDKCALAVVVGPSSSKTAKMKRRVSFSKASPRVRSQSSSGDLFHHYDQGVEEESWLAIQEQNNCWSSDLDESDTTEFDEEEEEETETEVLTTSAVDEGDNADASVKTDGIIANKKDDEDLRRSNEFIQNLNLDKSLSLQDHSTA